MLRATAVALAAGLLLSGCSSSTAATVEAATEAAAEAAGEAASEVAAAATVEASPVQVPPQETDLRVLLTPEMLRDRRLPTRSLLPPPAGEQFAFTIGPITPEIRARMGESWSAACPVALTDLRYVTVTFRGFDGLAHTGDLVLANHVARDVIGVFRTLFEADFPIEEMRLVTTADHHAPKTGDGNSTAAYNCRSIRGGRNWSEHALGTAVDINPFHNPMLKRGVVTPEKATAYVDRTHVRPGMIVDPGVAVQAFAAIGWKWGGHWNSHQDWMHFSATGR